MSKRAIKHINKVEKNDQLLKPKTGKELVEALTKAGLIGMWKDRLDITDSVEFANKLRREID